MNASHARLAPEAAIPQVPTPAAPATSALPSVEETLRLFDDLLETDIRVSTHAHPLGEDFAACQAAAKLVGLTGHVQRGGARPDGSLAEIAASLGLCVREVRLNGAWWTQDHGVLVARQSDSGRAVVLRSSAGVHPMAYSGPGPLGRYLPLTPEVAATLEARAIVVHPTLTDKALGFSEIVRSAARLYPFEVLAYLALTVLIALLTYAVPVASQLVIDHAVPHRSGLLLIAVVTVVVGSNLMMLALRYTCELIAQRLEAAVGTHVQAGLLDRLFRMPMRFFSSYGTVDLMRRFTSLEAARRSASRMLVTSLMDISTVLVGMVMLLYYFPLGAVAVAAISALSLLVAYLIGRRSFAAYSEGEAMTANVMTVIHGIVANMWPIRSFGAQRRAFTRWRDNFIEMRRRSVRSGRYSNLFSAYQQSAGLVTLCVVFSIVAYAVQPNEGATLGHYVAFVSSLSLVTGAVGSLASTILGVFGLSPSVSMAQVVLSAQPEPVTGRRRAPELQGEIELTGVHFRYSDTTPWVLSDLSLRVAAGDYVGVVGPSGCGKSTLMRLLLGVLPPDRGRVAFDNLDLADLQLEGLRRQCGVMMQESRMFPGSILDNIAAGRDIPSGQVLAALEQVGLGPFVRSLPMGVHTVVGEGNPAFSGGQAQLMALARALAGQPKVLIVDEPTSALDAASLARVGEVLRGLPMTRIVLTHRLGTLKDCDRIVVLQRGAVVQQGRFDELAGQDGLFQQLLNAKAG